EMVALACKMHLQVSRGERAQTLSGVNMSTLRTLQTKEAPGTCWSVNLGKPHAAVSKCAVLTSVSSKSG
ncbi:Hypothetical predicted protein, partial [Marmota monax]